MVACFLIESLFLIFKIYHPEDIVICQDIHSTAVCHIKTRFSKVYRLTLQVNWTAFLLIKKKAPNFKDQLKRWLQIGIIERVSIALRQGGHGFQQEPVAIRDIHGN